MGANATRIAQGTKVRLHSGMEIGYVHETTMRMGTAVIWPGGRVSHHAAAELVLVAREIEEAHERIAEMSAGFCRCEQHDSKWLVLEFGRIGCLAECDTRDDAERIVAALNALVAA